MTDLVELARRAVVPALVLTVVFGVLAAWGRRQRRALAVLSVATLLVGVVAYAVYLPNSA